MDILSIVLILEERTSIKANPLFEVQRQSPSIALVCVS